MDRSLTSQNPNYKQCSATAKRIGSHSILFIDDTLSIKDAILDLFINEFESMYAIVTNNIGQFYDRDNNGKVVILLVSFSSDDSPGGYFYAGDFYFDADMQKQGKHSNEMDIIYIRGNPSQGWEQYEEDYYKTLLTTLIHEYQHLVNFCTTLWTQQNGNYAALWINEMMSMAVETMYFKEKLKNDPNYENMAMVEGGYLYDRLIYYNTDPNNLIRNGHGLTYWDYYRDPYPNYSLAYLFGQYLSIHANNGQGVFKDILNNMTADSVYDYTAVADVAKQKISGIASWEDLLKNWAIANMLNKPSGLYGYKGAFTLTPYGPISNNVNIHNGGIVYRKVSGSWTRPPDAGANIKYFGFSSGDTSPTTTVPSNQTSTTTSSSSNTSTSIAISTTTTSTQNTTSTVFITTTTTIRGIPGKPSCAAEAVLNGDEESLSLLRDFRDNDLLKSETGKKYVDLYYQYSPAIVKLIEQNPDLKQQVRTSIMAIMPTIQQRLRGMPRDK